MCLILFSWKAHPNYPLIVAANRDEFYSRPTKTVHWWDDQPNVLAGRDEEAGGTWMGMSKSGRFASITNYRQFPITEQYNSSRGELVASYLADEISPEAYLEWLKKNGQRYEGFNLIFGNPDEMYYFSNRSLNFGPLSPGIHGLSNHLLNTPWPKVEKGKKELKEQLKNNQFNPKSLSSILHDQTEAPIQELPDTGIGLDKEKQLSSMFIKMDGYGTRASSVTMLNNKGLVQFLERSHVPEKETYIEFTI